MRREQVPQDDNRTLGGHRKAVYAADERGRMRTVESTGWSVEELVTSMAVEEFEELARDARARVQDGRCAPLAYHMYRRRMDTQVLAQAVGMMQWRVRRHLRPGPFRRLPPRLLQRYAEALGMSVEALVAWPPEEQP
ncbi:hypothetical protein H0Z60_00745 [Ectothiorhodospiraceae bacterium WFHF3C12]|nr:hypothetical protein [Ectothiorhodospiraceae bacterium WFHF3C12]